VAGGFGWMVGGVVRRTFVMATRGAHRCLYVLIVEGLIGAYMCS